MKFSATTVRAWTSSRSMSGRGVARCTLIPSSETTSASLCCLKIAATVSMGGCFLSSVFILLNPQTTPMGTKPLGSARTFFIRKASVGRFASEK